MLKRFLPGLMLFGFVLIFSACGSGSTSGSGGGGGYAAPVDATITSDFASFTLTHGGGAATSSTASEFFNIVVKDKNGIPLEDVYLSISFIWAVPHSSGVVQLYDGSAPNNSPMSVTTDINGAYKLRVDLSYGTDGDVYSGSILITSGSVSTSIPIEVKIQAASS